jgi:hypothetical protein
MYVIIGSHCVPLEGKYLLLALAIVRITLNRQVLCNPEMRGLGCDVICKHIKFFGKCNPFTH